MSAIGPVCDLPGTVLQPTHQPPLKRVRSVKEIAEQGGGRLDADTVASETSWTAALLAAGIAIDAAENSGFALVRPPGHHARPGTAMGFCLVNNVAVAARHMQAVHGLERVAIVDYDVHHGNGTEEIFWEDDTVLFVSLHQWPFYPGTGGPTEQSETTVNVPLSAGSGDEEYFLALATRYTADANEHAATARTYRGTKIAQAAVHCDRLVMLSREEAKEATAAAAMHKQLGGHAR